MQTNNSPVCKKPLTYQSNGLYCNNCQKYIFVGKKKLELLDIIILLEIIIVAIIIYWFITR